MEDVIKPAKALFKALREAKTREEAAQAATVYWNTCSDGTVTGNGRLDYWQYMYILLDYLPSGICVGTMFEERARIMGPDGIQAEIIFVQGERAAIKIAHDFITGYPSVVTLTLPARFFGE